tara:strand:- start:300 stop:875 length:576 start_codon:yes stop_codon:yes gene_type:complete
MPAKSKAQQRFFGMVRAAQKGEMASPSPEVSKAASSMSKSDVKKFAKTKHKGLPNKVEVEEESKKCKAGSYYCYTDKKCKPIPKGFKVVGPAGMLRKENGHTQDEDSETKNGKKNGNGNGNGGNGNGNGGGMSESTKYDRYDKEKKQFAKADKRMKFGKFYDKAKEAKGRLRPGEVKRYDKELGRYVSNKE